MSLGSEVGSVVTTITANDVDSHPSLTYSFPEGTNPGGVFTMDRWSGRITLAQPLDAERQKSYMLHVTASDAAHVAQTKITINIRDENDNPPVFHQNSYQVSLPGKHFIISVNKLSIFSFLRLLQN